MSTQSVVLHRYPDIELEVRREGAGGPTLLLLPGLFNLEPGADIVRDLATDHRVIVPTHPGQGGSTRPSWCDDVGDLVFVYRALVDQLGLDDLVIMGCSFGGWVAAEIAVHQPPWLRELILVDAVGIRSVDNPVVRDIADVFALRPAEVRERAILDAQRRERLLGVDGKSDDEVAKLARDQELVPTYGWEPYLHNPKLAHRLGAVTVPTLVIWGERDGIVTTDYGRRYADAIPHARFEIVPGSAHMPHIERPSEFARLVRSLRGVPSAAGRPVGCTAPSAVPTGVQA